jgi:vacuolar-type H+-ATPase subunit F/Vma7
MELAVIGGHAFTLGFRLTGIKKIVEMKHHDDMQALLQDKSIGVIITDQETFDQLPDQLKEDVTTSIKPVAVVVSDAPQEELRKMIIRSIGVDLLKD